MAQVSMTVRMDYELKQAFDALCTQFGMSANTAMNVFAKAVVQRRRIPFEIKANDDTVTISKGLEAFREIRKMAESGQLPDLTLDEINEEIRLIRSEKNRQ
ncbi:MAG: type II toxin-antitoxin system RelB/DinJ family antitoxin [Bacteroidaceae bacterium]|jgi:addiction module RelB/DinJ family antitoxin|nr:type II toxin-antitoxin system RelB/DinJ family antitoxin [Bacteroidaceae bacterium]